MDAPGNWQNVIDKIVDIYGSDNRLDTFETCTTDRDRVSLLAEHDVIGRIDWVQAFFKSTQTSSCKRLDTALRLKREGTALFQKKMYIEAAKKYSEALMNTPFDSEELAILYGNRSACLFYLQLLKECLIDVESAKKCNFPGDKLHKLLVREINCYIQIGRKDAANQCLEYLHKHMENDSMDCKLSGEKLPPIVIRKSLHPRCFKSLTPDKLPVRYYANTKAWMTTKLMEDWLKHVDRTMRKKRRHILLFLDNAPSHPHLQLTNVKIMFFPPNTTSFCQPMDQGIIQTMKLKYRKRQLQHVLVKMDQDSVKTGPQILKEINVLQAINWVNRAWCETEPSTIEKCFKKAGFGQQTNSVPPIEAESLASVTSSDSVMSSEHGLGGLDEDDFPLSLVKISNELFGCEVQDLINIDSTFRTCDTDMSQWDSNAMDILQSDQCVGDDDDEGEQLSVENSQTCVSLNDATDYLEKLREFALQIGNGSILESVMDVKEQLVEIMVAKTSKQTSITDFFQKPNSSNGEEEMSVSLPCVSHGENKLLVQASQAVDIQHSDEQGRYLMATQDISKGDTLIVEQPYAAVLLPENMDTHCQHCYTSLKLNFYPCRRCISVKYCSIDCEGLAWERYHRIECPYLTLLHSVGIAHLSLRVVIVAGLDYLQCFMNGLPTIEEHQKYKGFDGSGTYCRSYQSVYDLMTHSEDMETEDLLQYTLTSLLLLEVLRHSEWFHRATTHTEVSPCLKAKDNKALTDDEVLIGSLLLRHILQLVCNAHAITQLQCTQVTDSVVEEQSQVRIATAIYPTASLMNHSCDPSIIASFNKDTLVVRAVKDIHKGEEVFNCYGPHCKRMDWDQRQKCLQQQYFFTCRCKPCTEGEKNSRSLYSYRCTQCEGPMVTEWSDSLKCQSCEYRSRLDLISVREADCLFEEGVKLLQENRTQDAVHKLLTCYHTRQRLLYKHNKVLSETQDCLARCYASLGNFKESSKFLQQSIETVKVIYGAESIETGNELQKLAEILISAHMWQEAVDCVRVALRIFTQHYGKSHDTVQELSNMEKQLVEVLSCS